MPDAVLTDAVGRPRSKVTLPGYLAGRAPHNKGMSYPADPPRVEEIIAVMRQAGEDRHGLRIRAVIAVLWRGGLRISESLALSETDVDPVRGSVAALWAVGQANEFGVLSASGGTLVSGVDAFTESFGGWSDGSQAATLSDPTGGVLGGSSISGQTIVVSDTRIGVMVMVARRTSRRWWRCCCTRIRLISARRGGSRVIVGRMLRIGC